MASVQAFNIRLHHLHGKELQSEFILQKRKCEFPFANVYVLFGQCWAIDATSTFSHGVQGPTFPFLFSVNLNLYDFLCCLIPHSACYIYKHIVVSNMNVFSILLLS